MPSRPAAAADLTPASETFCVCAHRSGMSSSPEHGLAAKPQLDAISTTSSRRSRKSLRLRRMLPVCLRGSSPDPEGVGESPAEPSTPTARTGLGDVQHETTTDSVVQLFDDSNEKMSVTVTSYANDDVVKNEIRMHTFDMSGGSPYGFRLTNGDHGELIIGKVIIMQQGRLLIRCFCYNNLSSNIEWKSEKCLAKNHETVQHRKNKGYRYCRPT